MKKLLSACLTFLILGCGDQSSVPPPDTRRLVAQLEIGARCREVHSTVWVNDMKGSVTLYQDSASGALTYFSTLRPNFDALENLMEVPENLGDEDILTALKRLQWARGVYRGPSSFELLFLTPELVAENEFTAKSVSHWTAWYDCGGYECDLTTESFQSVCEVRVFDR